MPPTDDRAADDVAVDAWFEELMVALARSGAQVDVADGSVSDDERDALLDLARVAAHRVARWTAPVSTYLAGIAVAGLPAPDRAEAIRRTVDALDVDAS